MRAIFDAPVAANGGGGLLCADGTIGQIERGLVRGFEKTGRRLERMNRALDCNDGDDMGLPFAIHHGGRRVEHADDPRFMAIATLVVDRLRAREQRSLAAMGLDAPAQGRLVFFELNDQMGVCRRRRLESFFGSAWRRA